MRRLRVSSAVNRFMALGCVALTAVAAPCTAQLPQPLPTPRITARIRATPLQDALKELSRQSGVRLDASRDVADIKVTLLVNDLPLDTLRDRLADVLHLTWARREGAADRASSYLIFRSESNFDEERELTNRGEQAFRKGIHDAIRAFSLAPLEREMAIAKNMALAETFRRSGGDAAVRLLGLLSPAALESIMDGNRLEFPSSKPPPELAPHLGEVMKQLQASQSGSLVGNLFAHEGTFAIVRTGEGADSLIGVSFSVHSESLSGSTGFSIKGAHAGDVYASLYTPNHGTKEYDDARVPRVLPQPVSADSLDEMLEKIADQLQINVVAESYRQYFTRKGPGPQYPVTLREGVTTAEQALDGVVWLDRWWKHGSVYIVQRPMWWVDRRREVTDATLAHVRDVLRHDPLKLDDLAEIGKTLTVEQWLAINNLDQGKFEYLIELRYPLRFYGCLSPSLRSELLSATGVDARGLDQADRSRLDGWLRQQSPAGLRGALARGPVYVSAIRNTGAAGERTVALRVVQRLGQGGEAVLVEQGLPDRR